MERIVADRAPPGSAAARSVTICGPMSTGAATTEADPIAGSAVYPAGTRVNERGRLEVGGCDVVELAREFGTPAYIYATDDLRARARAYLAAFGSRSDDFEIVYASKAAPITAVCRLFAGEGLGIDVASGGELHIALAAGFDPARIHMHGNNKSDRELRRAVEAGVGHVICDSLGEIERLDAICAEAGRRQAVLIRVTPAVEANTHTHIRTGQLDSKFGLGLAGGLAAAGVEAALAADQLELVGLHAHIGSQILELEPYARAIEALGELADPSWCRILNVGGGLGIAYTRDDRPPSLDAYAEVKVEGVKRVARPAAADPGRARPLAGRQRRDHHVHGGRGEGDSRGADLRRGRRRHVRQPAPDALRGPLRGGRRRPRRRPGDPDGDGRRQALRVLRHGRPRRRARRPAPWRRPRHPRDRRLRPRDGKQLQRRPAAAGDPLRRRRRRAGRPPRDRRRPDEQGRSAPPPRFASGGGRVSRGSAS